ncbi:MAG TPA: phosphatase PAP2 family protein [Phycisphaerales bacterium]|nr:phosphatase PAP2 family protein [Phycisphaerales bacterium]
METRAVTRRVGRLLGRGLAWVLGLGRRELRLLAILLVAVIGVWFFLELADEVTEGESKRFDTWVVERLREPDDPSKTIGPDVLAEVALELTALGSNAVLALVTGAVAGYLWLRRKRHAMWLVLGSVAGGAVVSTLMKLGFDRARPDIVPHLTPIRTASFPSGHAMLSAVVWITLGALLASLEESRRLKVYILSVALVVTLLVGLTRVFLGVHYPTDVLAGWSAGLSWAILCWVVSNWLQRRGTVESGAPTGP